MTRYGVPRRLSLQGEGEPTLNHDFFAMAAYARAIGAEPFTITNGTYKYPEHFLADFRQIGHQHRHVERRGSCEHWTPQP